MNLDGEHPPANVARDLILVLACVVALVLPFVLTRHLLDDSGAPPPAGDPPSASQPRDTAQGPNVVVTTSAVPSATRPDPAPLKAMAETCRLANLRQQAPLSAAEVSLAQFDKHIDAMNLLVAGKISLAVARTFWDQTRVGATQNTAAFRHADQEFSASATRCPALDPSVANTAPYGQVVAIKSCADAIAQRAAVLARARTAVTTWEHHVHDMEMLRMGHITPAQATAAWRKNWKTGERQLHAYDSAAAKAKKIRCSLD
jgi:hypothetical protein